jgi:hypothetical protein
MNYFSSFFRCVPELPEPDHPQTLPRWTFQNGSVVYAYSFVAALRKLESVQTQRFWASETDTDLWDVQFDDDVCVENVRGLTVHDAVDLARFYLVSDSYNPQLVQ